MAKCQVAHEPITIDGARLTGPLRARGAQEPGKHWTPAEELALLELRLRGLEHLRQEMVKTEGPIAAGLSTRSGQSLGATVDSGSNASEVPESLGAEGGTRTPTPLRAHDPESCASANSATSARARPPSYGPRV